MLRMKNNHLLLKKIDTKEINTDGLVHTDEQKDKVFMGEVVAICDQLSGYEVGDVVLFGEFATDDVHLNGHTYSIIDEENIYAIKEAEECQL